MIAIVAMFRVINLSHGIEKEGEREQSMDKGKDNEGGEFV